MKFNKITSLVDRVSTANQEIIPSGMYATCIDFIPSSTCTVELWGERFQIKGGLPFSISTQEDARIASFKIVESGINFTTYMGVVSR